MLRQIFMVSLLVLLAACGSSPKTDFYMLNADHGSVVQSANLGTGPAVGVWQDKTARFARQVRDCDP